jgi:hypothetical protein
MDHDERVNLTAHAFARTLAGNTFEAAETVDRILSHSDFHQMFAVCCAWASAGAHALRVKYPARGLGPNGFMHLAPDLGCNVDPQADGPFRIFARRFIVAFTNRDHSMQRDLFTVAHESAGDQFARSVAALLAEAADMHTEICKAHET